MERARSDTGSLLSRSHHRPPRTILHLGARVLSQPLTGRGFLGSICALLLLVIITLRVLNTVQVPTCKPLDLAEHERIRREWDKEIRGHEETRVKWKEEKMVWEGEHEETRIKWEEEKMIWKGNVGSGLLGNSSGSTNAMNKSGKKSAPTGWDCYGTPLGMKSTVPHITHEDIPLG